MEPTDKILGTARERFSAAFGDGATAINWQAVLAALMQILSTCAVVATPANLKAQAKRPTIGLKIFRRLHEDGMSVGDAMRTAAAALKSVENATDEEINTFVLAARETE